MQAGARTTNVDHSPFCLDVGMANFRANGIPLPEHKKEIEIEPSKNKKSSKKQPGWRGGIRRGEGHEFVARDVFTEMQQQHAKGKKFDIVLLDPPALARTSLFSGTPFSSLLALKLTQKPACAQAQSGQQKATITV